ncbi:MAG TPA: LamG-like jellyroll fold domain-containing protein, partial [Planctomycetota bacterium]|nr:LamG-like jellyroll fold domain-containing protein [Planctomycetota bacterium]
VGRATARDYAAAISDLERQSAGLKEADAREEAAEDLKDLKKAAVIFQSSLDALKKKPRGSVVTVQVRQPSGETKRVAGLILQIDAQRVEIQAAKTTAFVDWEDVATSTLAEMARSPKMNPRILAELCLLEGEVDAAKAYEADLSPKWWTYGARARSLLPRPDPGEKSAREVYYAAERGFRSMETRAAAIESYKILQTDFASTSLVKAYSERIARRSEAGREYYFAPADFHAEGTFKLLKSGKLESVKDSDDPDTLRNVAEIQFAALPNVSYRCWLWAGACCEETFLFYLQGTEVMDTDPKTRKKVACEPGSNVASPVKHSIRGLKKTHAEHKIKGAKEHPKTAAHWEWIEIPLPKYATAGGKKLLFMTNQAGFTIGGAIVSSTRKSAPTEPELKDLDKDRETPEGLPLDPDLVAWWTFEEGGGDQVLDVTGRGHDAKVVGPVKWVDGKIGGGMRFSSPGPQLRVEDAPDLRIAGDLTLALWMKKEGEAGDWSCLLGKGEGPARNYCLWVEARTRMVMFQEHNEIWFQVKSKLGVTDGVWTHVAATVEGSKATLYVNGLKDGELIRAKPALTAASPLGIGWACDHAS